MKRTRDQKLAGAYFATKTHEGTVEYWVHIPFADGWIAAQRIAGSEGEIVVSELRIFPLERPQKAAGEWSRVLMTPNQGLSTPLVRRVPVGTHAVAPVVMDFVGAMLLSRPHRNGVAIKWPAKDRQLARRVIRDLGLSGPPNNERPASNRGRPGRKPSLPGLPAERDQTFYEEIAADYKRWAGSTPARRIADKWGIEHATARTYIHTARHKYGLLPPTKPGYESPRYTGRNSKKEKR